MYHGVFDFWSCLFGVLYASCSIISTSFLRWVTVSSMILLKNISCACHGFLLFSLYLLFIVFFFKLSQISWMFSVWTFNIFFVWDILFSPLLQDLNFSFYFLLVYRWGLALRLIFRVQILFLRYISDCF